MTNRISSFCVDEITYLHPYRNAGLAIACSKRERNVLYVFWCYAYMTPDLISVLKSKSLQSVWEIADVDGSA